MSGFLSLVGEADAVALTLEQTKQKVELAKLNLEAAKQELERVKEAYEDVLTRAEGAGLSKAKLKKLVEERIQEMANLGLVEGAINSATEKQKRSNGASRSKKMKAQAETDSTSENGSQPILENSPPTDEAVIEL